MLQVNHLFFTELFILRKSFGNNWERGIELRFVDLLRCARNRGEMFLNVIASTFHKNIGKKYEALFTDERMPLNLKKFK